MSLSTFPNLISPDLLNEGSSESNSIGGRPSLARDLQFHFMQFVLALTREDEGMLGNTTEIS